MTSDIDKKDQSVEPSEDLSLRDWASFTPGQPLKEVRGPDEEDDEEDEEGEQSGGSGDGKHPKSLKAYRVHLARVLRFEKEASEEEKRESVWKKLLLLMIAPFSRLVPGGSGMATETDLGKKLFMGEIGIRNREIESHDIADPHLIRRLEDRLKERLEKMGFSHADHSRALAPEGGFAPIMAMVPVKGKGDKSKKPKADQKNEQLRKDKEEEEDDRDYEEGAANKHEGAEKPASSLSSSGASIPSSTEVVVGAASLGVGIPDLTEPLAPFSNFLEKNGFVASSEDDSPKAPPRHFEVGRTPLAEEFRFVAEEQPEKPVQTIALDHQLDLKTPAGPEWSLTNG
jgi:hypothetical protein